MSLVEVGTFRFEGKVNGKILNENTKQGHIHHTNGRSIQSR